MGFQRKLEPLFSLPATTPVISIALHGKDRETWSSEAATKQRFVRSRPQRDSPPTLCPPRHYIPVMSLRAERSNLPYPAIRDCFAPLAMTQRVFSARQPCLRETLPLKDLRKRMREFPAEKTRRCGIAVRRLGGAGKPAKTRDRKIAGRICLTTPFGLVKVSTIRGTCLSPEDVLLVPTGEDSWIGLEKPL
jgi:hypothetical protein